MIPAECSIPVLPRGVRLHEDRVCGVTMLLAPERALRLDPVGEAILREIDGSRSFGALIKTLASRYQAPRERIAEDAGRFLAGLNERRLVETRP